MLKIFTIFFLFLNSLYSFEYVVGGNIQTKVDAIKLHAIVFQGKDNYEGIEIVINKTIKVPLKIEKKWMLRVLSSENVPKIGERSPNIIFIKSF